jgi:gluconate 2-dehydrogenase gamma chain
MPNLSRRDLLKAAALVPAAALAPAQLLAPSAGERVGQGTREGTRGPVPAFSTPPESFFSAAEAAFVAAAVARLIPADELGPGAREADVAVFIDRQLAGPYGRAETWYMQGPWSKGTEQQGYQLKLTPAQLYRTAIREIDDAMRKAHGNRAFSELDAATQDQALGALEKGEMKLPGDLAKTFFTMLLQNTTEGFLADPMYGGNRDYIGWKLIGFPGPRYNYVAEIEQYGKKYDMPEVSVAGADPRTRRG